MRPFGRFAGSLYLATLGFGLCLGPVSPASSAAVPQIKFVGPCTPSGPLGVCFGMPPAPSQGRNMGFVVPANGTALVTVSGSGYCINQAATIEETADFETEITDNPATVPSYQGAGGLRVKFRIPKTANPANPLTFPFNVNSSRAFPVTLGHNKNFIFAVHALHLDPQVACYVFGLNMTVVFVP